MSKSAVTSVIGFVLTLAAGTWMVLRFDQYAADAEQWLNKLKPRPVHYIADEHTHLCFAVRRSQSDTSLAMVPCTDAVLVQALKDSD